MRTDCVARGVSRGGLVMYLKRDGRGRDSDFHLHICTSHERGEDFTGLRRVNTCDRGHMFSVTTECTCVICPLVSDATHVTWGSWQSWHVMTPGPARTLRCLIPPNYHPYLLLKELYRVFTLNARIDRNQPPWNSFEHAATYSRHLRVGFTLFIVLNRPRAWSEISYYSSR